MEEDVKEDLVKISNLKQEGQLTKLDILKKLSSGTELRDGINDIVNSGMGALIVVINPKVYDVFQGGFEVNCDFTSKRLVELGKMDGAIILSEDFKKILYANTLLVPESSLPSFETGIRHQAAERTAKQTNALVIAVSQRRGENTIYYGDYKYVLQPTEDLLRRSTETLQILEKQREIFNEIIINLNILELTNLVSIADVCRALQRIDMIKKMANIINEYIIELGKDGIILRMRMREIMRGIEEDDDLIVKDYIKDISKKRNFFDDVDFEEILDLENIALNLFEEPLDREKVSKGYRILNKTSLTQDKMENLLNEFKNLENIFNMDSSGFINVLGVSSEIFKKEINNLREQILMGKRV